MFRCVFLLLATVFLVNLSTAPAAAQGACSFCDTNPPPRGEGGGRPGNGGGNGGGPHADLQIETDIDFGRLVIFGSGPGTVVLDLQSGTRIVSGGLDELGGMPMTGKAIITGRPLRIVRVTFPDSVTMRDISGGTATLRDFRTDLPALPVLDATGRLEFNFTGRLETDRVKGGDLRGRIPITVAYD